MEELFQARYNTYWYLSFFLPLIIMLGSSYFHKKSIFLVGIALSLTVTYFICDLSINEKWEAGRVLALENNDTSYENDIDEESLKNKAFYIASTESILYTIIWSFVGWQLWPLLRKGHISEKLK